MKNKMLKVQGTDVVIFTQKGDDYISLTDIARHKNKNEPKDIVKNWMRSRSTIEFLGLWEKLNNPDFKGVEFDPFEKAFSKLLLKINPNICNQKRFLCAKSIDGECVLTYIIDVYNLKC